MREPPGKATARETAEAPAEPWLEWVRRGVLVLFLALFVFTWMVQSLAGRVVWTVAVASLPLIIVLAGYHRWRHICPLAWFAQLPTRIGRPGERRASPWLQANYYYLVFSVFLLSLWLRLIAINGDGQILAAFLVLLSLAAFAVGAAYTGKTWCNYVCPVSFVEKIYTEPRGLRQTPNSQCPKCTACKPACPDINEENGYWKEILSRPKRFVYFAFPGLVFSFYLYYFLQAGSWEYYFGGAWTNEPGLLHTAFRPGYDAHTAGFFFAPQVPRALAALLTLAAGALASLALFSLIEKYWRRLGEKRGEGADESSVRHLMFTVAAFAAFVAFYTFAGAPTLRLLAGVPHLFQILVVGTATLFLVRRFARRQQAYAEETLARQIIRRWAWADMQPPKDLHEAFLIHSIRSQTHASGYSRLLEIYKEAVRDALASGFVSRAEVQRLESLRTQLQIGPADHEKVMADLDEEERARISDPALHVSAEKRLQLDSYGGALAAYLEGISRAATVPDDTFIRHLRQEYGVSQEEHAAVLHALLGSDEGIAPHVANAFQVVEQASHTLGLLHGSPARAAGFLAEMVARRLGRAVDGLMRGFGFAPDDEGHRATREGLLAADLGQRQAAVERLGASVAPVVAARLKEAHQEAARRAGEQGARLAGALRWHLDSPDPYVRVSALYLLDESAGVDEDTLTALIRDEHEVVRETAICLLLRSRQMESREQTGLVTVERMMALRAVPLFSALAPEELAGLARASIERTFAPVQSLCVEGEPGDEVFILLSGDVKVFRQEGAGQKLVGSEKAGGFLGEMAVIDPAPRAASVVAGPQGTRVLCLSGGAFREVLRGNPSVVTGVIRALATRLRGAPSRPRVAEKAVPAAAGTTTPPGESGGD